MDTPPRSKDIAGVRISTLKEAHHAVSSQLRGIGPWSRCEDPSAIEGLERAIKDSGPWQPALLRALVAELTAPDLEVRTAAVVVAGTFARELGAPVLLDAVTRLRGLYDGVAPVGWRTSQPDLRWTLLVALGQATRPVDAAAIAVLRDAVAEPRGWWLLGELGRVDPDWVISNAARIVPKATLGGTLLALPTTAAREALIRALGPWSPTERDEALATPFWPHLPDAEALRALLRGGAG